MKRWIVCAGTGAILLLGSGCTNLTVLRIEELKQVEAHVDTLKAELTALQEKMLLEQKGQTEMLRLIRADQQLRFAEFDRKLTALAGDVSESQARLSQIDQKTLEIKKRWEEKAREDSLSTANRTSELENLFSIALSDFNAGRYDISVGGFRDMIDKFPGSSQAEESVYWLAECSYVRDKYEDAAAGYKDYIKKYSSGSKICAALFKLGLVYEKLNQKKARDMVWAKLVNQCPNSEEAEAAKAQK